MTNPSTQTQVLPPTFDRDTVLQRVCQIAAKQMLIDLAQVLDTSHLEQDLNMDSLDRIDLMMLIEDTFGVNIPDEYAVEVRTIGDAVDALLKEQNRM